MTLEHFSQIYAVLALQLAAPNPDNAAIRAYYRVLKDCEPALLQLAAEELSKTAAWFPKSSEWLKATVAIKQARLSSQRETLRQLHRRGLELCEHCSDTGWTRDASDHVSQCACQELRRAEIVGVKPLPALTA